MKESNYEITKKRTAELFLKYDQESMIQKYNLKHDVDYLYLDFLGQTYRLSRATGLVERCSEELCPVEEAGYNEAMSVYDILCYAKDDAFLSGQYCPTNSLTGIIKTSCSHPADGSFQEEARYFDTRTEVLAEACQALGGVPEGKGDVAYRIQVFPFLPVIVQFWNSDEEFEPELQFLWDTNVLQYLHFEILWYVMGHMVKRLREMVENRK